MKIEGLGYMGWGPTITEEETLGSLLWYLPGGSFKYIYSNS
jgi:hypothetical protein